MIWTATIFAIVVAFACAAGIAMIGSAVSAKTTIKGALVAGSASLVPPPGWQVLTDPDSTTSASMTKDGAVVTLSVVDTNGTQDLAAQALAFASEGSDDTLAAEPITFNLASGQPALGYPIDTGVDAAVYAVGYDEQKQQAVLFTMTAPDQDTINAELGRILSNLRLNKASS